MGTAGYDPARYGPEVRRGGGLPFGQFATQWMCDPRYTTNVRTLYGILITYADTGARGTERGRPYRQELAAQLGVSVSTLDRTVFEGECAGLWRVKRRTQKARTGKKANDANVYYLLDAEFWRNAWTDPLRPGQAAADVAKARLEARRTAKKAAGIEPKGGRKKADPKAGPEGGGVTSDATPEEGGGVTGDARGGVTGDARGGVTGDAQVHNPGVHGPTPEPTSVPPLRPSVSEEDACASTDGWTDGSGDVVEVGDQEQPQPKSGRAAAGAAPLNGNCAAAAEGGPAGYAPVAPTPGVLLLAEIGAWSPEYLVTGRTLADQGLVVTGMLEAGWKPSVIKQVITGRPLPVPMRRTVGAIIAARLREAAAGPVPSPTASWGTVPIQAGYSPVDHSSTAVAGRTVDEAVEHRTHYECAECGRPPEDGIDLCAACADWPTCTTGCGRHVRHEGICPVCAAAAVDAGIAAAQVAEDGSCPGYDGPCGRPVLTLGLCGSCRIKAEVGKRLVVQEWEAARDAAVASMDHHPEGQPATAPF